MKHFDVFRILSYPTLFSRVFELTNVSARRLFFIIMYQFKMGPG
jgi:hypothetical protein